MVTKLDPKVVDYEEIERKVLYAVRYDDIELTVLHAVHCDGPQCRNEPVHIWEILKLAQKEGVSERRTKEAIDFLKNKGYIINERGHPDLYTLTKTGEAYFIKLATPKVVPADITLLPSLTH